MDKNVKAFIEFGRGSNISKKQAVDFFVLSLIFIVPIGFIGEKKIVTFVFSIILLLVSVFLLLSVWQEGGNETFCFKYRGVQSILLMVSLATIGYRLLLVVFTKATNTLMLIFIILYLFIELIYIQIIKRLIAQGAYLDVKQVNTVNIRIITTLFGVFGIFSARIFLKGLNNDSAIIFVALCCFLVSVLSSLGVPNLYKYLILRKENPIRK